MKYFSVHAKILNIFAYIQNSFSIINNIFYNNKFHTLYFYEKYKYPVSNIMLKLYVSATKACSCQ